jgi:TIR domain
MSHIFVSYSKKNKDYALKLVDRLLDEGFDVWIDNRRLRSSEDWWRSIVEALRDCGAFVVVLTPESDSSEWVQLEITLAMKYKKPRFPLWLAGSMDTPNWALFARTQYIDVTDGKLPPADFYTDLAEHVHRKPHRGSNITSTGRLDKKIEEDPILQEALNNPPRENGFDDDDSLPHPPGAAGRTWVRMAAVAVLVVALLVGVLAIMSRPSPPFSTLTPSENAPPTQMTALPLLDITATFSTGIVLNVGADTLNNLNAWRLVQGYPALVHNNLLDQVANDHLIFLSNLSTDDLKTRNIYINDDGQDVRGMAQTVGYTGQVEMFVYADAEPLTLAGLLDIIDSVGSRDVQSNTREIGLAQDRSPDTGILYLVLIMGTGSEG